MLDYRRHAAAVQGRRREVAASVLRVIARQGVAKTSLRNVADGMRIVLERILQGLQRGGMLIDGVDVDRESERLRVLLDGLAISGITQPPALPSARSLDVLRGHLDTIVKG